MRVFNKMDASISVLKPGGGTFNIPPHAESDNVVASATLIKTLITIYKPDQIELRLYGSEVNVQDQIEENLALWMAPEEPVE
jgi:hypothetical protein